MYLSNIYRGDEFRELRQSIISENVGVMALTATVTKDMLCLKLRIKKISLRDPALIGLPPSQPNITYKVKQLPSLSEFCDIITGVCVQLIPRLFLPWLY